MLGKRTFHHSIALLHSGLAKYYYHKAFYSIALNLISIFIPIYLLTIGFSLIEVAFWLVAMRWVQPFFSFQSGKLATRIGMRKVILLSLLLSPVFFFLVWQIEVYPVLFMPTAIMWGALSCAYWTQEFTLFIEVAKTKRAGFEKGVEETLQNIAGMLAPLAGGFILAFLGMPILISLSSVLLVISVVPLVSIKRAHFTLRMHYHDHSKRHRIRRARVVEMIHRGFHNYGIWTFLPLFLFLSGVGIVEVGFIGTIMGAIGILVPVIVGKLIDSKRDLVVIASSFLFVAGWIIIILSPEKTFLYMSILILGVASHSLWLTICKQICTLGKGKDPSYFGTAGEVFDDMGAGIGALTFFLLLFFVGLREMVLVIALVGLLFGVWKIIDIRKKRIVTNA